MPSDVAIVIASVSSGGFALLGVGLSNRMAKGRERAAFRAETAFELAEMERLVWGDDWIELQAHIQRQQARLAIAGVSEELIEALTAISIACWQDLRAHIERTDGVEPGIRRDLLEARRAVNRATRADLLREESRSSRKRLRAEAMQATQAIAGKLATTHWLTADSGAEVEILARCETRGGIIRRR